ncbi:MAG: hypothetical protein CVU42_09480 [Chloroflexi bacterium HGW-Chloroflexi-4]|nr:MAG: hypothetical protein CVU42_09480 [Chloroflexi bacterium HGW-Chloroflexi-4]
MTLSYDGKKLRTINFLIFPLVMFIVIVASCIYGFILSRGTNVVAIFIFIHFFRIILSVIFFMLFFSIMYTVGQVGLGDRQNLLVFINLGVWLPLIIAFILSFTSLDNKPQTVLNEINTKLFPVIEDFFSQKSIKPLDQRQNPKAPYFIVDASVRIDEKGDYIFSTPAEIDDDQNNYAQDESQPTNYSNTYKQDLHLLQIFQSGQQIESYKSIAVIVHDWVLTGRMVKLDYGSVPELRQQVKIYIVDVATWQVIDELSPIIGGRAIRPFGGPGAGTIYIKEVRGKEVKESKIRNALDKLSWE